MKIRLKKAAATLTALVILFILPNSLVSCKVSALSQNVYDTANPKKYSLDDTYNKGIYFEPIKDGKYPVLFVIHGSGGYQSTAQWMPVSLNKWVSMGYVDPMVLVIPQIDRLKEKDWGIIDFGEYVSEGYCKDLVDHIKEGKLSSKADTESPMSIAGYSMGGSTALFAGVRHPDTFINIGGMSPSWCFYSDAGYTKRADELVFSKDEEAHFVMGYGLGEAVDYHDNVYRNNNAIEGNGLNKKDLFKIYEAPFSANGKQMNHDRALFSREIFTFLYYVKNDIMPTDEVIEAACGSGKSAIYGQVSLSGTLKAGETLKAFVSDSNTSDFSYRWRRGKEYIDGAVSSSYTLTEADSGKKISCEVTDKSGALAGMISATTPSYIANKDGSVPVVLKPVAESRTTAYSYDETYNKGSYLEPEGEGKYPPVILLHGVGTSYGTLRNNIPDLMDRWTALGYIEPMVVVMPDIPLIKDTQWGIDDFGDFVSEGYCKTLADNIKSGKMSSKIDTSKTISIAGVSMGGSSALYAGVKYPETFINVGGLSPSWCFYSDAGYIKLPQQVVFSDDKNGHFLLAYGKGESEEKKDTVERITSVTESNGKNRSGLFSTYIAPDSSGGSGWQLFKREIFNYLYYIQNDELPSAEITENACGDSAVQNIAVTAKVTTTTTTTKATTTTTKATTTTTKATTTTTKATTSTTKATTSTTKATTSTTKATTTTTKATTTTTKVTTSITTTAKPAVSKTLGDPNTDGIIDAVDAAQILRKYALYSSGTAAPSSDDMAVCDVNNDGFIDSADSSKVLAYYAYSSSGGTLSLEGFLKKRS